MTDNEIIVGLTTILVFGVGAQWIGRRTGIPSLLLLLPAGVLAGDVLGLVNPEELFGDTLNPLVTLLVALLLFHSGIQLQLQDLPREARGSVARLVSIGMILTFAGATGAVALSLEVPAEMAFLTGAILVVSGPTVVGPLLNVIRPREPTGRVLLWEGTVLDPIGAILGVVVLNLVIAPDRSSVHPVAQLVARMGVGLTVGLVAAAVLVFVMSRFLLTDDMDAAVALMLAAAAFGLAEVVMSEAGLFATVTLGIIVANQRLVSTRNIEGFGETLEVLIIGTLFVVLGALVTVSSLASYAGESALIVAALVLVVRPLAVAGSLLGSPLSGRDRAMIAWMDPRGIVAAATAAAFTATLASTPFDADFLLPVTFGVILGTGVVYGLTGKLAARVLGVARPVPRTIGLVGDDPWLLPLARQLNKAGVDTLLITTAPGYSSEHDDESAQGRLSTTSLTLGIHEVEAAMADAELAQVLLSVDDDAALTFIETPMITLLERRHIHRVPYSRSHGVGAAIPGRWTARAFGGTLTRVDIQRRLDDGATLETVSIPIPPGATVLAVVNADARVDFNPSAEPDREDLTLIALVDPPDASPATPSDPVKADRRSP